MKKFFAKFSLLIVLFALSASAASAADFKMGENVLIEGATAGDNYVMGGNVTVQTNTNGDLFVAGGQVTVNGNVAGDAVVVGGKVNIMGNVGGDLRVMGGQVAVFGNVGEDIVISGGQIDIAKDAVVRGEIYAATGVLTIDGSVLNGLHGMIGSLILNGSVGGNVVINVQDEMHIAKGARVGGSLNYTSIIESEIPAGVVNGPVSFNKFNNKEARENMFYLFVAGKIWSLASILLLALIMSFVAPNLLKRAPAITRTNIVKAFGVGMLTMIFAFIGALILFTTVIGVPLGLIVLAWACIATYVSKIFAALFIASYGFNLPKVKSSIKLFGVIALAMSVYYLVTMVPLLGWIISFVMMAIGLGTIVQLKKELYLQLRSKKII